MASGSSGTRSLALPAGVKKLDYPNHAVRQHVSECSESSCMTTNFIPFPIDGAVESTALTRASLHLALQPRIIARPSDLDTQVITGSRAAAIKSANGDERTQGGRRPAPTDSHPMAGVKHRVRYYGTVTGATVSTDHGGDHCYRRCNRGGSGSLRSAHPSHSGQRRSSSHRVHQPGRQRAKRTRRCFPAGSDGVVRCPQHCHSWKRGIPTI